MKSLDERLIKQAGRIFSKASEVMSKIDPALAAVATMAAMAPSTFGAVVDASSTLNHLQVSDPESYKSLMAALPDSTAGMFLQSVKGQLASPEIGKAICLLTATATMPFVAGVAASLNRSFVNLHSELERLQVENKTLSKGAAKPGETVRDALGLSTEGRISGATRMDREELLQAQANRSTLSEQLDRGLKSLEDKMADQTKPRIKGPGV
tara:strand:- start:577 stop:1206 length:630 start_codon:yes stop_codon:yes gene_type:complete